MKCYNCGPGTPEKDDAKVLCPRCADLYTFSNEGHMIRRKRVSSEPGITFTERGHRMLELSCPHPHHWTLQRDLDLSRMDVVRLRARVSELESLVKRHGLTLASGEPKGENSRGGGDESSLSEFDARGPSTT